MRSERQLFPPHYYLNDIANLSRSTSVRIFGGGRGARGCPMGSIKPYHEEHWIHAKIWKVIWTERLADKQSTFETWLFAQLKMEMRSQRLFLERNLSALKLLSTRILDEIDKFEVFNNFHFRRRLVGIWFYPCPHPMMKLKTTITSAWPCDRKTVLCNLASQPYYVFVTRWRKSRVRRLQIILTKYWNPEIKSSFNDVKWFFPLQIFRHRIDNIFKHTLEY